MRARTVTVATLLLGSPAWAGPPQSDLEQADALFQEGRALMDRGELAPACSRLERSFQLAPRLGTMLNLGACFEQRGQLARALAIYERAATVAREAGRPDRERAARDLAAAVEPKVARLLVVAPDPVAGTAIDVDGDAVSTQGGLLALDPGERHLRARAPGKASFSTTLTARAGETLRVTIPRLQDEPHPSALPTAPPSGDAPQHGSPARIVGVVAGLSLVLAGATVGTVFGLQARSKRDQANPHCDAAGCDQPGLDLLSEAKTAGNVSTVAFVVAGVGLLGAVTVFLVVPDASKTRVGVALAPTGAALRVTF